MIITIDTEKMSELDQAMLAYLAGAGGTIEAEEADVVEEPPKKAAAPTKKAAAKAAPEPEPEPEEDLLGGPTVSDAIAAATKLVSDGEANRVKAALAEVGVKKVSDLSTENVAAFLAALEAE